jgi:hypothetical protein
MKISRWIYVPLATSLTYAFFMSIVGWIFDGHLRFGKFVYWLLSGALIGFVGQYLSNRKAKKVSGNKDERAFDVYQNRSLVLLTSYKKAFDLCREAVLGLKRGKIKSEDFQNGAIAGKVALNWDTWGEIIDIDLRKINENLTEIEISVSPALRTMLASHGRSWKIAEDICLYLKEKDAELNKKVLADSVSIMEDVYIKPFQKEKIER